MRILAIEEAQSSLNFIADELIGHRTSDEIALTVDSQPVLALLSYEYYESLIETLEILSDAGLVSSLISSAAELRHGETIPWETVRREPNLD